jgi:hypothetical protein
MNAACLVPPVFVVGLPRCGSTLLSRLLNETEDILCVNDLYYVQAVQACGGLNGTLSAAQIRVLVKVLLDVIAIRSEANNSFIGQFILSRTQLAEIFSAAITASDNVKLTWSDLMQYVMNRVAYCLGKSRWADKTPQNFLHIERLAAAFPNARFVYLMRDPRAVLLSYKHASGEGHDPRRYHPLVYSLYWRTAVARYNELRSAKGVSMLLLRYEDLKNHTEETCWTLGKYLGTTITAPSLEALGNNSSFTNKRRPELTGTETWLCEKVCGRTMAQLGYAPSAIQPRLRDLPELARLSFRFSLYQVRRMLGDPDGRKRITNVLGRIVKKRYPFKSIS